MIPRDLDKMEPGIMLAAILSSVDVTELSGYDRIVLLRAQRRMISHFEAQLYESMASVSDFMIEDFDDDPMLANEAAAAEIRAALRLTRRAADNELAFAIELQRRLPAVWEALCAGDIDSRRARLIVNGTTHLPVGAARNVVAEVIDRAPGLTTGQLGARIRQLCIEVDPEEARQRYEQAVEQRRVVADDHRGPLDGPPGRQ